MLPEVSSSWRLCRLERDILGRCAVVFSDVRWEPWGSLRAVAHPYRPRLSKYSSEAHTHTHREAQKLSQDPSECLAHMGTITEQGLRILPSRNANYKNNSKHNSFKYDSIMLCGCCHLYWLITQITIIIGVYFQSDFETDRNLSVRSHEILDYIID